MKIKISMEFKEGFLDHVIEERWTCGNYDEAKSVLKEVFDIPSFNGFDNEDRVCLTAKDLGGYSLNLWNLGIDEDGVREECDRLMRDSLTYGLACRFIKGCIEGGVADSVKHNFPIGENHIVSVEIDR